MRTQIGRPRCGGGELSSNTSATLGPAHAVKSSRAVAIEMVLVVNFTSDPRCGPGVYKGSVSPGHAIRRSRHLAENQLRLVDSRKTGSIACVALVPSRSGRTPPSTPELL